MQKNLLAAAAALTLLLQGCATLVGDETQTVPITSTPSGASVTITDESGRLVYRGTTPASVEMNKSTGKYWGGKRFKVTIAKYGYSSRQFTVSTSPNAWYLAGNFLVSGGIGWFLVDPFSGKMYSLSPEGIDASLGRMIAGERAVEKQQVSVPAPLPTAAPSAPASPVAPKTPASATPSATPVAAATAAPADVEAVASPPSLERGVAVGVGLGVAVGVVAGPPAGVAAGLAAGVAAANGAAPAAPPAAVSPAASPVASPAVSPSAPAVPAPPAAPAVATPVAMPDAAGPAAVAPAKDDGAARRKKDVETAIEAAPQGDFGASEAIRRYAPGSATATPAPAATPQAASAQATPAGTETPASAPAPAVAPPPPPFRL